ncbi:MAG: PAS domain S-box protein [Candidatus Thermoplasmatota archaeon]
MTPEKTAPGSVTMQMRPEQLLEIWHRANDVLYVHDLGGRFLAVNATASQTYGYTPAEFLGMSIKDLVDPEHLGTAMANLTAKASGATEQTVPYELLTRAKDGRPVWVEVSTRVLAEDGHATAIQGSARDITKRKLAEAVADLVHETALAVHEARSLEAGIQAVLGRIATVAGWSYGEAWFPDVDGRCLTLGPQWVGGNGLEKFSRLARQYQFAPGEGVPGRIWADGKPVWGSELPGEADCPRRAAAHAAGLRTFAAIPVANGGQVAAVLVFFGTQARHEDARWVAAAEKVAAHLGASIGRRLDVERVRSAGRLFAAQFEALGDAMLMLDAEGVPRQANAAFLRLCDVTVSSNDAAVPLTERVDDLPKFLAAVTTLYEDRSAGRDTVSFEGRNLWRNVAPLRSRNGTSLGVLLQVREDAAASSRA